MEKGRYENGGCENEGCENGGWKRDAVRMGIEGWLE